MKKDVLIKMKDKQTVNGEVETMELITKGELEGDAEDYTLVFTERFDEEFECLTRLRVQNGQCVTMIRSGAYNSEMIIEHNKRHNCHYVTPYGEFLIGIFAKGVRSAYTKDGGTLHLHYTIDFYSGLAAENEMTVNFEPFSS
ncbi:MAG: DUF1934 domain-containing protein [Oscillospiraceae bacterium]|jgi:uncharacterized beta-barrel protein YwiB (DUF1934 family)|nr:DUF1934 domain-containing protein [Oscillospiraceae bacterium]